MLAVVWIISDAAVAALVCCAVRRWRVAAMLSSSAAAMSVLALILLLGRQLAASLGSADPSSKAEALSSWLSELINCGALPLLTVIASAAPAGGSPAGGLNMGWASGHIERLRRGETASFRPRGHSMSPRIESGQLCTVAPVDPAALLVGDIVLCKVKGSEYLHLVKAIQGGRYQIGNNRGFINGWIGAHAIYGGLLRVDP